MQEIPFNSFEFMRVRTPIALPTIVCPHILNTSNAPDFHCPSQRIVIVINTKAEAYIK